MNSNQTKNVRFLASMQGKVRFDCAACGRCCGQFRILLSPYDIIRLRKVTDCSSGELIKRGTVQVTLESFRKVFGFAPMADLFDIFGTPRPDTVPIATLRFRNGVPGKEECEFLLPSHNGRRLCGIYHDRPAMCRLHPLGYTTVANRRKWFFREPLCEATPLREQTIEAWIRESRLGPFLRANSRYRRWMHLILDLHHPSRGVTEQQLKAFGRILYDYDSVKSEGKVNLRTIESMLRSSLARHG